MDAEHKAPNYMAIFWWLLALTIAEVAIVYMSLPRALMVGLLVGMAIAKAALVAMYFMHLRFEKGILSVIALTPPILLMLFVIITYPDAAWRLFVEWGSH